LETEPEQTKKEPGRPKVYSDNLMVFALIIKFLMGLTYRELQGFLTSFFADLRVKTPDFRTIHYRFKKLSEKLEKLSIDFDSLPNNFVIAIDSTGIKRYNRGEWNKKKHKKKSRKGWIKIHAAVDVESKQLVALEITEENIHDSKMAMPIVQKVETKAKNRGKKLDKVLADKGYDTRNIFDKLKEKGIFAGIIPRKGSKVKGNSARDDAVRKIRRVGIKKYKEEIGYGKRNAVESFFSVFKRRFGEHVESRKWETIRAEIVLKAFIVSSFMKGNHSSLWCVGK